MSRIERGLFQCSYQHRGNYAVDITTVLELLRRRGAYENTKAEISTALRLCCRTVALLSPRTPAAGRIMCCLIAFALGGRNHEIQNPD